MDYSRKGTIQHNTSGGGYPDTVDNFTLWRLFFITQSAVGRLRDLELSGKGVTPEQSGALFLLARNNGKSTIPQMAEAWLRQRNSVSTLMDRMSRQGLVKKYRVPGQRELEIEITPKGREMHNRLLEAGKVFEIVFADLSDAERKQLADFLRSILLKSLRQLNLEEGRPPLSKL